VFTENLAALDSPKEPGRRVGRPGGGSDALGAAQRGEPVALFEKAELPLALKARTR
jgi:hypothetical protein